MNNKLVSFSDFINLEKTKPYFLDLLAKVNELYKNGEVFPSKSDLFNSLKFCKFENLKVVILGQDPYHTPKMADGLAFSTQNKILPPSLKNIFKELDSCFSCKKSDGDLKEWAKQGVFLHNIVLTVEKGKPNSHSNLGWQDFTKNLLNFIVENKKNVVFLLLGKNAFEMCKNIDLSNQKVFALSHPSPYSAHISFLGSKIFIEINEFLKSQLIKPINWCL